MARRFRFGVNLFEPAQGDARERKCRRVEALGYDVLQVPDHLDWPAPFPSLVAAANATRRTELRRAETAPGHQEEPGEA